MNRFLLAAVLSCVAIPSLACRPELESVRLNAIATAHLEP